MDAWPFPGFGVPVWHLHESLDRLDLLANAYSLVALGSSGEYASPDSPKWWARMAEVMECVCIDGQPVTKLHGLRMLDPTILAHLPLASADSTNVARNIGLDSRWTASEMATRQKNLLQCGLMKGVNCLSAKRT